MSAHGTRNLIELIKGTANEEVINKFLIKMQSRAVYSDQLYSDKNNKIIEMFQVLVAGSEIVKAYSELVDPQIQRAGFEEQMRNKAKGDDEAFELDEDFLLAMEHGMPPMSGLGMGIDRLMCIICNQPTLRDVILFPNMK